MDRLLPLAMQKQNMFIVILAILPYFATCQSIDVDTPSAKIKGRIVTQNGKSYSIFQGIPFAKPPIGNLRFKVGTFTKFRLNQLIEVQ